MQSWHPGTPGVVRLPSGRLVRGRGLRDGEPDEVPDFGLYLLSRPPAPLPWASRWVRWPDLRLPVDAADARDALLEAWHRAAVERVEVACGGGRLGPGAVPAGGRRDALAAALAGWSASKDYPPSG